MSSSDSSSQESTTSLESNDFDMEVEDGVLEEEEESQHGGGIVPYANEPIASQEWQEIYDRRQEEDRELLENLKRRLDGLDPVDNWYVSLKSIHL